MTEQPTEKPSRKVKFVQFSDELYLVHDAETIEHLMSFRRIPDDIDNHWMIVDTEGKELFHTSLSDAVQFALDWFEAKLCS